MHHEEIRVRLSLENTRKSSTSPPFILPGGCFQRQQQGVYSLMAFVPLKTPEQSEDASECKGYNTSPFWFMVSIPRKDPKNQIIISHYK